MGAIKDFLFPKRWHVGDRVYVALPTREGGWAYILDRDNGMKGHGGTDTYPYYLVRFDADGSQLWLPTSNFSEQPAEYRTTI